MRVVRARVILVLVVVIGVIPSVASGAVASVAVGLNAALPPGVLQAVSCTSRNACTAVGSTAGHTLAVRRDGASWTVQSTPNPDGAQSSSLSGVSCTSPSACMAVGQYTDSASNGNQKTLAERWDGTRWSILYTPTPSGQGPYGSPLSGVSCTSADACIAVGGINGALTLAEGWNGREWVIQPTPTPPGFDGPYGVLTGVSCTSPTACSATGAGYRSAFAEHWDGSTWELQATDHPGGTNDVRLPGVSCTGPNTCTGVGGYGLDGGVARTLAEHSDRGTDWHIQSTPNAIVDIGSENTLEGVSCVSMDACVAVGYWRSRIGPGNQATLVERWDGTNWSILTIPNPTGARSSSLLGVSCVSPTACVAVGSADGAPLAQEWDSPAVSTVAALSVSATGAALSGTVNPQNLTTTYHFDYGTTTSYGSQTTDQSVGSDASDHAVLGAASGLVPDTTYHFRVVASNAVGTSYGNDQTFTTQPTSSTQPTSFSQTGSPPATPAPMNSVSPSIGGTPRPGALLTCSPGTWSGAPSLGYEWLRDGASISHANTPALRLSSGDVGHRIACRVTARNSTGSTSATSATIRIVDLPHPRLSDLKLSPTRFTAATTGPSILTSGTLGTRVNFTFNEQAKVTFRVQRLRIGRQLNGHCRAPTHPNRKAKRCNLYVIVKGGFTWSGKPGPNTFRFTGRINGRRLAPGGYRIAASARDTSGSLATPARVTFTVR